MAEKQEIRKIIHVDMDAFFASVEQRDFPELRGKPIAVGGSSERGVVAAASYEARKFGVHSALASAIAKRRCPDLIFVKHRFEVYKAVSKQIRAIFHEYTDLVEPLSLDEAYLDVTTNKKQMPSATLIAKEIKARIKEETQLIASAGISINKFLAKVASDLDKPDGLSLIPPDEAEAFVAQLEIDKFHGIGKVTAAKMKKLGIFTGLDMRRYERHEMVRLFGKVGGYYYNICRGIDGRKVTPNRPYKSVSSENTFEVDLTTEAEHLDALQPIVASVARRLAKQNLAGRTVTLKMKYFDFQQQTRSKTLPHFVASETEIWEAVQELLVQPELPPKPVRLFGVGVANLNNEPGQKETGQLTLSF